ncbi:hypothetical protein BDW68DRAFT_180002 [Aspergillus falconensis]
MANKHWRNENALGGAHWLHPRTKETKRAVELEEEDVIVIKVKDEDDFPGEQQFAGDFGHGSFGDEPEFDTNPLRAEHLAENRSRIPRSCWHPAGNDNHIDEERLSTTQEQRDLPYALPERRRSGANYPARHVVTLHHKGIDQVQAL